MISRTSIILLASAPLLTYNIARLRTASRLLDRATAPLAPVIPLPLPLRVIAAAEVPLPPMVVTPADPTPPGPAGVTFPRPAGSAEGPAPDLPDVTPAVAGLEKAGQVRRGEGPPCHECRCCRVYATRMATAHTEIDRLRLEILVHDAEGTRKAAQLQSGHRQQ